MKLDKLFGSKTKVDIIKYLLFKRQGISIRALENDLTWSFPAIKKQVDLLVEADIVYVEKDNNKWSIYLNKQTGEIIKKLFLYNLEYYLKGLFKEFEETIEKYFLGRIFEKSLDINVDLVIIYNIEGKQNVEEIKMKINGLFRDYFIDIVGVVFMSGEDFQRRYRLADKFILNLISRNK